MQAACGLFSLRQSTRGAAGRSRGKEGTGVGPAARSSTLSSQQTDTLNTLKSLKFEGRTILRRALTARPTASQHAGEWHAGRQRAGRGAGHGAGGSKDVPVVWWTRWPVDAYDAMRGRERRWMVIGCSQCVARPSTDTSHP
eukprot:116570-Chlamydomonas_euryale.AAC.7